MTRALRCPGGQKLAHARQKVAQRFVLSGRIHVHLCRSVPFHAYRDQSMALEGWWRIPAAGGRFSRSRIYPLSR